MAAADEDTSSNSAVATSELGWKKFKAGAANFTLAVTYNYPPLMPTDLYSNPGGGCHTSSSDPALIGNDDISFYSRARDLDGDNQLTTSFSLHKPDGSLTSLTANVLEGNGESKPWIVARTQITDLNVSGGEYYYQTTVTDDFGLSSSPSPACWILYNPNDPPAPTVTISPTSAAISQQVTVTITTPSCSGTTGSDPCPVSYMVQNGVNAPFSTSAGTDSNHTATPTVLIRQQGSINISVSGVSAGGNIGEQATQTVTGTLPSTPFKDGYFTNGANPDLLTVGTGSHPSLWLYTGSGVGTLNGPTDIGSLGTTINPGTDGPGDWAGAIALHGDFTGDNVQDVMAYYTSGTHAGNGVVIPGDGSATSLNPTGTDADDVMAAYMAGPSGTPSQLVGAGQAGSGQPGVPPTATDNLIGIAGGVELDLYSEIGCRGCGYGYQATLTLTAPDGTASTSTTSAWSHYTIAATHTGATTSLFALNTTTGALYETTGPFAPGENPFSGKTPLSVPWGSSPPQLLGADVNQSGTTELWVRDDVGILEYTVSGTNVQRGCQPISENDLCHAAQKPFDDWPLNDGKLGSTKTTAIDTLTGIQATVKGGASWVVDYYFRMVLSLDGTTGYVLPPSTTIPAGDIGPSISAWFKTTSPGVLASVQADPVTSGSTTTKGYDPVLYVGTDGKLNAKWWNGSIAPIVSTSNVNDNQWHHVELITTVPSGSVNEAPYQTLYIDGHSQGTQSGGPNGNWNNLTFGSGYIGGGWPDEVHYQETGSLEFFNGQIANVTFKG